MEKKWDKIEIKIKQWILYACKKKIITRLQFVKKKYFKKIVAIEGDMKHTILLWVMDDKCWLWSAHWFPLQRTALGSGIYHVSRLSQHDRTNPFAGCVSAIYLPILGGSTSICFLQENFKGKFNHLYGNLLLDQLQNDISDIEMARQLQCKFLSLKHAYPPMCFKNKSMMKRIFLWTPLPFLFFAGLQCTYFGKYVLFQTYQKVNLHYIQIISPDFLENVYQKSWPLRHIIHP